MAMHHRDTEGTEGCRGDPAFWSEGALLSHYHHIAQVDKYRMLWYLGEMHETHCDGSGSQSLSVYLSCSARTGSVSPVEKGRSHSWSSARHWKCRTAATLSWVRIPPCPPYLMRNTGNTIQCATCIYFYGSLEKPSNNHSLACPTSVPLLPDPHHRSRASSSRMDQPDGPALYA